ncbi:MAG: acyl carrier protein [Clostridia bacterium]|nr:acyl carrier protein [Clostridia bacterium]
MIERVIEMLASQLGVPASKITPESEIVKDLGADSLDVVELLMSLEEETGITIPDDQVEGIKTVQDIVNMLETLK